MRSIRVFQVDAFTDRRFSGNPACVVLDAGQLSEDEMRAIAREMNKGDTAFVLPPAAPDQDLYARFFSPKKEMPFVGHATLATHAVLSGIAPRPLRRQGGPAGVVEVRALPDGRHAIWQSPPQLGRAPDARELDEVLGLLGLDLADLDPRCPPRIAGVASTRLLIALRDAARLDTLQPQLQALGALSSRIGAQGYFPFAVTRGATGVVTESRMFCPALGIDEDPVSGNAHAMLGVYLHQQALLQAVGGVARFTGLQGRHMHRAGQVDVEITLDADGRPAGASIAGRAVIVFETRITLD